MIHALLGINASSMDFNDPRHPRWYEGDAAPMLGVTPESAMRSAAVYACVRVLAESVASLPLKLYRRRRDGGKDLASNHPLWDVLHDQPNNWQTNVEFWEQAMYHVLLRGNAMADLLPGQRGGVDQMEPIHPDRVEERERLSNNTIRYTIRNPETNQVRRRLTGEVLHIRGLSSDGVWGIHPIKQLRRTIAMPLGQDEFADGFFRRGVQPSGVVTVEEQLTDEVFARIDGQLREHMGSGRSHGTLIFEEGAEWKQVSMTNKDAQFIEARKFSTEEIARIFRVPPHMIQDLGRATNNNIEQQSIDFVVHSLRPWLIRIEKAIRRDVISQTGALFAEFLVDALLRGEFATRFAGYATAIQNEILSVNEVRTMENRNPREGGDEFRNPAINPQPDSSVNDDGEDTDASRLLSAYSADIGGRIARRELKELASRVKHADKDSERFSAWLKEFYTGHAEYVDNAIAPLCDALQVRDADRIAFVEGRTAGACREILSGDVSRTVEQWGSGELEARYVSELRGLAA